MHPFHWDWNMCVYVNMSLNRKNYIDRMVMQPIQTWTHHNDQSGFFATEIQLNAKTSIFNTIKKTKIIMELPLSPCLPSKESLQQNYLAYVVCDTIRQNMHNTFAYLFLKTFILKFISFPTSPSSLLLTRHMLLFMLMLLWQPIISVKCMSR